MVIETTLILVRALAVPVPAGLGVQDLGYVLSLKALGVPAVTTVGAALVLLKRGKDIFWILRGFVLLGLGRSRAHAVLGAAAASPRLSARAGFVVDCPDAPRHAPGPRRALTCAVMLSECEAIDAVELVHPQDVSERRVAIGPGDILANVPYHPDCGMWFDNHLLTDPKAMPPTGLQGALRQGAERGAPRLRALPGEPSAHRAARAAAGGDRPARLGAAHDRGRRLAFGLRAARLHARPAHRPRQPARVLRQPAARAAPAPDRRGARRCRWCASA